jgi:hypothetical protein
VKYFTPELYLAFNSEDSAEAQRAESNWEEALGAYRRHIESIRSKLPPKTRQLAEKLCLHDAEYLGLITVPSPQSSETVSLVAVQQDGQRVFLIYLAPKEPFVTQPVEKWRFSRQGVHWLYDEVDVAPDGLFSHDILLSDGRVISLRFSNFDVMKSRDVQAAELTN